MLPFPCFEVEARFDGGMSSGPVFDETGAVCGIICSGIDGAHESGAPVSYVTTIWPIFGMIINADRQGPYPRGVSYPVIELVHGGQVQVPNLPALEKRLSAPNWPKHTS
jgi:hypothetical protein